MLKLIVDSASDLSPEMIASLPIEVLPTPVYVDDVEYLDGKNLTPEELAPLLENSGHKIKTRHVKPSLYEEAFLKAAEKKDHVICLCFSTGIAGNYQSAKIGAVSVKEYYPDFDITILDSKCASCGYGMMALKLGRMIKQGAPKEKVLKQAAYMSEHMQHLFSISVTNYFMQGGRIARVLGNVGNTLNARPIMTLGKDGTMQLIKPMQGTTHAVNAMLDIMKRSGVNLSGETIAFCYGNDKENLDDLVKKATELFHPKEVLISRAGCAVAAHTGNSILGICYLK